MKIMKMTENTQHLIEELFDSLDEEIILLKRRIDLLKKLSPSMAGRDEHATEKVLDEIELTQVDQEQADRTLSNVRGLLADALGLDKNELKLSRLMEMLPPINCEPIRRRRKEIIELAEVLRMENLKAAVVLSECAHLNHLLMQSIMPRTSQVTTYGAGGTESWQSGASLVDAKG